MFPQLVGFEPVEETTKPSYNDGGNYVTTVWEGPNKHYLTKYNDWNVEHPDTSIFEVERVKEVKWKWETLSTIKYGEIE